MEEMKEELKIVYLPVDSLTPYEKNARKHTPHDIEAIKESIKQSGGFNDPIGIWGGNNLIVEGHGRLMAAKELGMSKVPCIRLDHMTEEERRKYAILHNRTAELSSWEEEILAMEISDLDFGDFDFGFELQNDSKKEGEEDNFDVDSELKRDVFSKLGDLWILGKHRVICGDSTGEEVYTRVMDGQKANLVLTDPPYNVNVEETAGKIMNDNMGDSEFYNFLLSAYRCMHANLADDGSIYVWHADTEGLNFRKAFKDAGFYLSGCCIWKKNSLVLGRSPYQWIHEPCLFGWKQKGKHQWYSDRKQTTVWEYDKPRSSADHPTMKPIPLMCYPIQNSTMTNGVVLDPFLGSGSTLIACCQTNRICRGIELDPKFVDVIVKRYIEWNDNRFDDVFVIRDGEKLPFTAVATLENVELSD